MKVLYIMDNNVSENCKDKMKEWNTINYEKDEIKTLTIQDLKINHCIGCFSCWIKTPGHCVFKDGMEEVLREILQSDLIIFVSPIKTGNVSSEIKTLMDRMIPLVLPYFKIANGKVQHKERYKKEYVFGAFLEKNEKTIDEDIDVIKKLFGSLSDNFDKEMEVFNVI